MLIVGERLNSTRSVVHKALIQRDEEYLIREAEKQAQAGVDFIDLNTAALLDDEIPSLQWAIPLIQERITVPLSIDTPNPEAMEVGLRLHRGQALLNSITGESKRINDLIPLIKKYRPRVISLCLDDSGLPKSSDQALSTAEKMVIRLIDEGVDEEDIFIDPLVQPISTDQEAANLFLDSLRKIKSRFPKVKTIAGISNVSFGLPQRKLINRTLLALALFSGLDAAILDPFDTQMKAAIHSTEALAGRDVYLKDYLAFIRSGLK
ncbi:dihydropteroate synthase [Acidobacteriota bacterium]